MSVKIGEVLKKLSKVSRVTGDILVVGYDKEYSTSYSTLKYAEKKI